MTKYAVTRGGFDYDVRYWDGKGKCPYSVREDWIGYAGTHRKENREALEKSFMESQDDPIELNADMVVVDGMTRAAIRDEHKSEMWYVVLEHLDNDIDSLEYMLIKQLSRRNNDESATRDLLVKLVQLENLRQTGQSASEDGQHEVTMTSDTPLTASRPVVSAASKQSGKSEKTVKRAVKDHNIVQSFPPQVKKHVQSESLTPGEIKKLDECDSIGEVESSLRMGRADSIYEAYHQVTGKPLKPARKKTGEKATGKSSSKKQGNEFDDFCLKMKGLMKSIDTQVEAIDQFLHVDPFSKDKALHKTILEAYTKAKLTLGKWHDRYEKRKSK